MTWLAVAYFGPVAILAAAVVWSGVSGRWSDDSWPAFALLAPWFWPLIAPTMVLGLFADNVLFPLRHPDAGRPVIWNPLKWRD